MTIGTQLQITQDLIRYDTDDNRPGSRPDTNPGVTFYTAKIIGLYDSPIQVGRAICTRYRINPPRYYLNTMMSKTERDILWGPMIRAGILGSGNLLVIDRVEVDPEFRGNGFGLRCVQMLVDNLWLDLKGHSVVMVASGLGKTPDRIGEQESLTNYWAKTERFQQDKNFFFRTGTKHVYDL